MPLGAVDLDPILCLEETRVIAPDNTVTVAGQVLQIDRQPGRRTCAGLRVLARQHLDGTITIVRPPDIRLGHFTADGRPWQAPRGTRRAARPRGRSGDTPRETQPARPARASSRTRSTGTTEATA
ncbi:MAG: hypothetical protein GEU99_08870 [Luteitalea sp.]|nr:hypothetical protein [Luteitalea sp.]